MEPDLCLASAIPVHQVVTAVVHGVTSAGAEQSPCYSGEAGFVDIIIAHILEFFHILYGQAKQYLSELDRYDLLILDVTLPDGTGFDVCERVRKENQQIPIIFLTASDEEVSIIRGLDSGGDDYITKPFKLGELCSRIRALLRRAGVSKSEKNTSMECGDITIDLLGSRATLKGKALDLTSAEYRLLCLLVRNANRVVTRDIILNELWDDTGNFVDDNTLSVYVRRLREKVETNPSHPEHLITIRGFGYQWKEVSI